MLSGKNVVLGVCGGIAAYKACDIVSRLKKLGANVDVIMTDSASKFVTPLTFQTLSQNPVVQDMFEEVSAWDVRHISLAKKADVFLIAPATANIIGKMANGIADDMLSTTVMATKAKILIAPAMNSAMYENPVLQRNIETLKGLGCAFVEPESGMLACGDIGKGKLAQPEDIVEIVQQQLLHTGELSGKTVLVTAGPTREAIDPVRYITNHSTGKMGYAIAKAAMRKGANVILVSGKTNVKPPLGLEKFVSVESTIDMYNAVVENLDGCDIIIKSAAVADYRPKTRSDKKIKKTEGDLVLELERNPDILLEIGKMKGDRILVGFAAETDDIMENAAKKIEKKNLDFIVANDITAEGAGFGVDTNIAKLLYRDGKVIELEKMSKDELSEIILQKVAELSGK
ncbi:MAG: bifunctional phosphopantothenoylcysteine decarboxylase/phosphopantothenate--cysteine ligase CoaBC [Peptoclostridium sp.]|uniref:bifunctional phosphopantothenoylcysteine decarboxylase/phosphopantothenate--cysteine ligase CoaBC n=1 Tax=Peptoclostridium sp. TaxID=1904860 RepID=UPI00139CD9F9|nr:bifunctional phosphopantothenoylcysteine decarboxylase/phosphopantothenate--cysteine ligase CoaBC [Peptoclostridium sp.]MZQ76303.1 bifunctional phosphopantothenoylcysteine decarboxylase/phosphopantothenate--cysteine ligase CoaBC [Peptoclostridium sp.]